MRPRKVADAEGCAVELTTTFTALVGLCAAQVVAAMGAEKGIRVERLSVRGLKGFPHREILTSLPADADDFVAHFAAIIRALVWIIYGNPPYHAPTEEN